MGFKINICPYFSVIQLQNWCMYMRCMFCVSHTLHPNVCVRDAADAFVQCVINSFELFVPATYFFLPLTECTKQKKTIHSFMLLVNIFAFICAHIQHSGPVCIQWELFQFAFHRPNITNYSKWVF